MVLSEKVLVVHGVVLVVAFLPRHDGIGQPREGTVQLIRGEDHLVAFSLSHVVKRS